MLSDGEDTSSLVSFDEVLELAKRSETAIYTIGLRRATERVRGLPRSGVRAAPAGAGNRRPRVLRQQIDELTGVYGQIADELSSQYTLGYASRNPSATAPCAASSCASTSPARRHGRSKATTHQPPDLAASC